MTEESWVPIVFKVISYVLTFLAGCGVTLTVKFAIGNYKKKRDSSITHQTRNIVGGDMAGRDIKK